MKGQIRNKSRKNKKIEDYRASENPNLSDSIQEGHTRRAQRGSCPGPYTRAMQAGEAPEGVVPRTIQEGHTRRKGTRGGQARDRTGGPYEEERSGSGPYSRVIQVGEAPKGIGSRTIPESHTRMRGTRGGRVQEDQTRRRE